MNSEIQNRRDGSYPVLIVLICLLLLSWGASLFSTPDWVYAIILAVSALAAAWAAWSFIRSGSDKRGFIVAILATFLLLNSIASQLNAPNWIYVSLIVLFIPVAVWMIRTLIDEWGNESSG